MLSVPAAPDPTATANKEIIELKKDNFEGEISMPTIQVNKTKDITLGFIKLKKELKLKIKFGFENLDFVND
tara:strand:- start:1024 stop:1236 length:213 start_codon:yes stop_codon:yes gene_type:complete